ncbi:hypothetical protein TNCV_2353641 [Trichonephila clavipes]|nr:hypothetical protein TNCV_2353641 [Trichonephila clavipes]
MGTRGSKRNPTNGNETNLNTRGPVIQRRDPKQTLGYKKLKRDKNVIQRALGTFLGDLKGRLPEGLVNHGRPTGEPIEKKTEIFVGVHDTWKDCKKDAQKVYGTLGNKD